MKIINTLNLISKENLTEYWNTDILNKVYFNPKKVDRNIISKKLFDNEYLEKIDETFRFIENNNIETTINNLFGMFEKDVNYTLSNEIVYIIIGLDTTTIYSTKVDNNEITVLCLESIKGNLDNLKMLLAHEFTHFVRKSILKKDIFEECIGERLITEGIASNYSREIVSNMKESEYCIVPDSTIEWVKNNMLVIEETIKNNLHDNNLMYMLFYMYAKIDIDGMPVRSGYVYGYLKVKEYLEKSNIKVKDILGINWDKILSINN